MCTKAQLYVRLEASTHTWWHKVLAVANKIRNLNPKLQKSPICSNLARLGGTFLVLKVELDHFRTRWKDVKSRCWFVKQQSLGSLRKVLLKIERSYGRKFLRATIGLGTMQLLFNTPYLITPRTWCKSKTNNLLPKCGQHNTYAWEVL
jgi:hypothetical protein